MRLSIVAVVTTFLVIFGSLYMIRKSTQVVFGVDVPPEIAPIDAMQSPEKTWNLSFAKQQFRMELRKNEVGAQKSTINDTRRNSSSDRPLPPWWNDPNATFFPDSPLHDKTLPWDGSVQRLWLLSEAEDRPPGMLLMTSYGWNHPDQTYGRSVYRGIRTREFMDGIINHPWFHPTAWEDISRGRMRVDPTIRYYVFLDKETCSEKNYPKYGRGVMPNRDAPGRGDGSLDVEHFTDNIMRTALFTQSTNAKFVLFDCGGIGPGYEFVEDRKSYPGSRIAFVSLSAFPKHHYTHHDQGLPPPACQRCKLSEDQRSDIMTCKEEKRHVLLSFSGMMTRSEARKVLATMHNGKDVLVFKGRKREIVSFVNETDDFGDAYRIINERSSFGAAPRGDNAFSYRFTELLSCGTIPVVYADGWVFPFGFDLVDWEEAAVIIKESDANKTLEILRSIGTKQRCLMRQKALRLYDDYLASGRGTIRGIIENFERYSARVSSYTGPPIDIKVEIRQPCPDGVVAGESPLADKTLCWRADVERIWMNAPSLGSQPPAMLLLTNYGWNSERQTRGKKRKQGNNRYRSFRSRELMQGVINHPWFHADGFQAILDGRMAAQNDVMYYVFLDIETCHENDYPLFRKGAVANADHFGGRTTVPDTLDGSRELKKTWTRLHDYNLTNWRIVFWDCKRFGPAGFLRPKSAPNPDPHLSVVSLSAAHEQLYEKLDQGLPFPAYRKFEMTVVQQKLVQSCQPRPNLLYFSGHLNSHLRRQLGKLHNGEDVWIGTPQQFGEWAGSNDTYYEFAVNSSFAAIPRGVALASSRLTEMLSAGCIPVILADDWVLPLRHAITWNEAAVILDERRVGELVDILRSVPVKAQCSLRQKAVEIYDKYFASEEGVLAGVIEGLEKQREPF